MMVIDNKFNIGDKVYLKTDIDQIARIVITLMVTQGGVSYGLNCGVEESWHFDFEITKERNVLMMN